MRRDDVATATRRATLDWREIHRRLDAAREAVEQGGRLNPENAKAVLRSRAKELAREQETMQEQDALEVIGFVLAHESYAVEARYVREVVPLNNLTPVPGMPSHVLGIINVRGRILFVIDIKKFFGLPEKGITDLNKVVILQSQDIEFGVLADLITGARTMAMSDLQTSLPTLTGIRGDYLKGVSGDRTVVLDANRLLSDENILQQV